MRATIKMLDTFRGEWLDATPEIRDVIQDLEDNGCDMVFKLSDFYKRLEIVLSYEDYAKAEKRGAWIIEDEDPDGTIVFYLLNAKNMIV